MSVIFLSHSSVDNEATEQLKDWLVQRGHSVFLDLDPDVGIPGGASWEVELYTRLRQCRALIAILTPAWLASRWCFAEVAQARALGKPIFPVQVCHIADDLWHLAPPAVQSSQRVRLDHNKDVNLRKLDLGLSRAGLDPHNRLDWDGKRPPYPGLASFQKDDAPLFFGRDGAVTDALAALNRCRAPGRARLVVIAGASGSGKSSLLRAGILPRLERDPQNWIVLETIRPMSDPFREFEMAVASGFPKSQDEVVASWRDKLQIARVSMDEEQASCWAQLSKQYALALLEFSADLRTNRRQPNATILVNIDQLEEALAAGSSQHQADAFLIGLADALAASDFRLLAVATLRADFLGAFQRHPAMRLARSNGTELPYDVISLSPMPRQGFFEIIEKPAAVVGLDLELGLAGRIVGDAASDDSLPVIAFALRELWDRYGSKDRTLSIDEYANRLGGLEGSIGGRAQELLTDAQPAVTLEEERAFRRALTTRLMDIRDDGRVIRRRAKLEEIPLLAHRLIDDFIRARLLVADRDHEGRPTVEATHEALFRRWVKLVKWIEEDRGWLVRRARLVRRLSELQVNPSTWLNTPAAVDLLQSGPDLEDGKLLLCEARALLDDDAALSAYLEASVAEEQRRKTIARAAQEKMVQLLQENAERATAIAESEHLRAESEREARSKLRRTLAFTASAFVIAVVAAAGALWFFADAQQNLALAHLLRADQLLMEEKSARANALTSAPLASEFTKNILALLASFDPENEIIVRLDTILEITRPSASVPERTVHKEIAATAAAFDADGSVFAVGYGNGDLFLFSNLDPAYELRLDGVKERIISIGFFPDGNRLVSATETSVIVWNRQTFSARILGGVQSVTDMAVAPNGRLVAWSSRDGRVTVWDTQTDERDVLEGHTGWVHALAFSADSGLLASIDERGLILVRNTTTLAVKQAVPTGLDDVQGVSVTNDGLRVATASASGAAQIWSLGTSPSPPVSVPIPAQPDKRWRVKFSPEERFLALSSWRGTVSLWDATTLAYLGTIDGHDHRVNDVAFGRGDLLLTASESGSAKIWDVGLVKPTFYATRVSQRDTIVAKYSPDGTRFITGGADGIARLYEVRADGSLFILCANIDHKNWLVGAAFSPDSKEVITLSIVEGPAERGLKWWRTDNCQLIADDLVPPGTYVQGIAHHPAADRIAWGDREGRITIMNLSDRADRKELARLHSNTVSEIDFALDGLHLVSGGADGRVIVWNLNDGSGNALRGPGTHINTVKFSPNGRWIAAGGDGDRVFLWDRNDSNKMQTLVARGGTNRLAFDTQSARLALGSDALYVSMWETGSWRKVFQLNSMTGVRSVYSFHPTRGDLAFDGGDGLVRVLQKAEAKPRSVKARIVGLDVRFDYREIDAPYAGAGNVIVAVR